MCISSMETLTGLRAEFCELCEICANSVLSSARAKHTAVLGLNFTLETLRLRCHTT
jgi:hypothetical protein